MNGQVDNQGRALIEIAVLSSNRAATRVIHAWIDTGFTGELVLSKAQIDDLALRHSGTVKAILADGSEVAMKTYACLDPLV
jgi:predicted aspartyl protease